MKGEFNQQWLPTTAKEVRERGWDTLDVIPGSFSPTMGWEGQEKSKGGTMAGTLYLCAGRFVNDVDLAEQRKVLVLSSTQADMLFPHAQAVGNTLEMDGAVWRVCGVYKAKNIWKTAGMMRNPRS